MTTTRPPMKLRAMLPYFGGKRTLAPRIVDALAPDISDVRQYFEPFHGSLAVLLEIRDRGYTRPAVVNDLHWLAHNLARVLAVREQAEELSARLGVDLCHEGAMIESARYIGDTLPDWADDRRPHFMLAYHYLRFSWLQRNGMAGTVLNYENIEGSFAARWRATGGDTATRFRQVAESVPGWWAGLQATTFLCRDGFGVIESVPDEAGVVVYLDPPYLRGTRRSGDYAHDFTDASGMLLESDDDHAKLAALCARFTKARVGVSYYDEPRLRELYPEADGWRLIDLTQNRNLANATSGSAGDQAGEVLVVNDRRHDG